MDATRNEQLDERTIKRRQQNAARVKRCRQRKKDRARCLRIEIDADDLDAFVSLGLLPIERRNDAKVIVTVIQRLCRAGSRAIRAGLYPPRDQQLVEILGTA